MYAERGQKPVSEALARPAGSGVAARQAGTDASGSNRCFDESDADILQQYLKLVAESLTDVVIVRSGDAGPGYVTPSIRALLGYAPAEFLSLPLSAVVHPADLSEVLHLCASLAQALQ